MQKIGEQLIAARRSRGMTQEALAQKLGVTNQAVSKWESGQCMPDIQLLPEIADFFSVSINELMGVETKNNNDDILIMIKNAIQNSESGTEMTRVMKMVKALHAIILVIESRKEASGYPEFELDETIDHAVCSEWGLSSITLPQIVTTMRRGSAFFSDDHNLYDENSIKKISKLMKNLSDKLVLTVMFAIYDITSENENAYASIEQICEKTDLTEDIIRAILAGELAQYCMTNDNKAVRIKGEYMTIPPILSILYPAV